MLFLERLLFCFHVGVCFLSFLNKLVGPPLSYIGLQIVWFGLEKSRKVHTYVVNRACFLLWPMLCHVMLDIVLALCLVIFAVAWHVIKNWDCLMFLERIMRCFSILKHGIVIFSFDALFGLTWRMLTPCYDYPKSPYPLWSFSFQLVVSIYALINNVLSLCMIMAIIALLVCRS